MRQRLNARPVDEFILELLVRSGYADNYFTVLLDFDLGLLDLLVDYGAAFQCVFA